MKINRSFNIEAQLWKAFRRYCLDNDTNASAELARLIEEALK